jgi:hypothetical protein
LLGVFHLLEASLVHDHTLAAAATN